MNIEQHLHKLRSQIYVQPEDEGHTEWATDAISKMCPDDAKTVLDIGCGTGFCKKIFKSRGVEWTGQDWFKDKSDFHSLPYQKNSFDMIFARHVLEHSPMPLIALMEWYRVSSKYAFIILPAPQYWKVFGKNHYYVLPKEQWWNLFDVAGWKIIDEQDFKTTDPLFMKYYRPEVKGDERKYLTWHGGAPTIVEFRYLLEKK